MQLYFKFFVIKNTIFIFHSLLQSDSWPASDDFLENIFSLDQGSLNFLEESLPDLNLTTDNASQPEGLSSSCSDSGLSSDPAEL